MIQQVYNSQYQHCSDQITSWCVHIDPVLIQLPRGFGLWFIWLTGRFRRLFGTAPNSRQGSVYNLPLQGELFKSMLLTSQVCQWHFEKKGLSKQAETRFSQRVIHALQLQRLSWFYVLTRWWIKAATGASVSPQRPLPVLWISSSSLYTLPKLFTLKRRHTGEDGIKAYRGKEDGELLNGNQSKIPRWHIQKLMGGNTFPPRPWLVVKLLTC